MRLRIPMKLSAQSISEAVRPPQFFTLLLIKIAQSLHREPRRVRYRRQGRSRLYNPPVVLRRVSDISFHAVAGRQPPGLLPVAFVPLWIVNTIIGIYEMVIPGLLTIIVTMIIRLIVLIAA